MFSNFTDKLWEWLSPLASPQTFVFSQHDICQTSDMTREGTAHRGNKALTFLTEFKKDCNIYLDHVWHIQWNHISNRETPFDILWGGEIKQTVKKNQNDWEKPSTAVSILKNNCNLVGCSTFKVEIQLGTKKFLSR